MTSYIVDEHTVSTHFVDKPVSRFGARAATLVLLFLLALGAPAFAKESACPVKPKPVPLSALLLKPPCDSCEETKAELGELQVIDGWRTTKEEDHALLDNDRSVVQFLDGMDVKVNPSALGAANQFFECVREIVEDEIGEAKITFGRTRPYNLPNNGLHVKKDIQPGDSKSYPSGHAAYGTAVGLLLINMVPELREKIYSRIQDFGRSRMILGVHFRSDIYAGQIAGAAIVASLYDDEDFRINNKTFREAFEEAKTDLRRALYCPHCH